MHWWWWRWRRWYIFGCWLGWLDASSNHTSISIYLSSSRYGFLCLRSFSLSPGQQRCFLWRWPHLRSKIWVSCRLKPSSGQPSWVLYVARTQGPTVPTVNRSPASWLARDQIFTSTWKAIITIYSTSLSVLVFSIDGIIDVIACRLPITPPSWCCRWLWCHIQVGSYHIIYRYYIWDLICFVEVFGFVWFLKIELLDRISTHWTVPAENRRKQTQRTDK